MPNVWRAVDDGKCLNLTDRDKSKAAEKRAMKEDSRKMKGFAKKSAFT